MRKKFLLSVVLIIILALSLSACSGGDANKSAKLDKTKSVKKQKAAFHSDVEKICTSIDQKVFREISTASTGFNSDPEEFKKAFQQGEDELDRIISAMDGITVPEVYDDDWETLIDDFSAIRDYYPKIGEILAQLLQISSDASASSDPAVLLDAQKEAEKVQKKLEAIFEDLGIRANEIEDIVKRLDIEDCNIEQ